MHDIEDQRIIIVEAMIQSDRCVLLIVVARVIVGTARIVRAALADARIDEPTELAIVALIGDLVAMTMPGAGVDVEGRLVVIAALGDDIDHAADGI